MFLPPRYFIAKTDTPCLVSHGSFLYPAALLAGTHFRLCLWFMNNIPITSAMFPVLCLVLGVFGKLGLISGKMLYLQGKLLCSPLPSCTISLPPQIGSIWSCHPDKPWKCGAIINKWANLHQWVCYLFVHAVLMPQLFCTNHNKALQVAPNCTWAIKPWRQIFLWTCSLFHESSLEAAIQSINFKTQQRAHLLSKAQGSCSE